MDFALDAEQDLIVQTVRKLSDRDLRGWVQMRIALAPRPTASPPSVVSSDSSSMPCRPRPTACSTVRTRT